jgi:catechol 1,2-dioxygenase
MIIERGQDVRVDDRHIDADVQFGVTSVLIGDFVRYEEPHPTEADAGSPWCSLD